MLLPILNTVQFTFSERDHNIMQTLFLEEDGVTPLLESQDNFKLLLHERDFVPGRPILANIEDAVTKSRRMVMLLSRYGEV